MNGQIGIRWLLVVMVGLTLTACGTKQTMTSEMTGPDQQIADIEARAKSLEQQEALLTSQMNELKLKEMKLSKQEQALIEAREQQAMTMQKESPMQSPGGETLFPPNAKLGECYARVFVPHKMQTTTEKVLKRDASERVEIIPAEYETVNEKVLAEAASERLEVIPAQYEWVEEKVLVAPAKKSLVEVPAAYETVSEKVLVKPAHVAWKKGTGPIQKIDEGTGEIMCLVEIPATYKTVSKRVLKTAATTKTIEKPAVYKTVKKKVMTSPPTTRVVEIPAKFKTIKVTKLVSPAHEKRIQIPAEYQTVTKQQVISKEHMEWVPILCETNMTRSRILDIQKALGKKGFNPGTIDGVIGRKTMTAVNQFQKKNGLLESKYLTLDTLKALGISAK